MFGLLSLSVALFFNRLNDPWLGMKFAKFGHSPTVSRPPPRQRAILAIKFSGRVLDDLSDCFYAALKTVQSTFFRLRSIVSVCMRRFPRDLMTDIKI